jgi:hypothetical protein
MFAFGLAVQGAAPKKYRDTSWTIKKIQPDWISISNKGKGSIACTLFIGHGDGKPWHVALLTDHFLVNNQYESLGVRVSFKASKPFTITNRSTSEFLDYKKATDSLLFVGSTEEVVNWIISKELIEVSIEEMGGIYKTFTFDTRGLREVMLEAQRRQRALK